MKMEESIPLPQLTLVLVSVAQVLQDYRMGPWSRHIVLLLISPVNMCRTPVLHVGPTARQGPL